MMLVNGLPSNTSKLLYVDTLKESLCPGTLYDFSAWILNTAIPANCNSNNAHFPNFTFSIETTSGQILQSSNTGAMGYDYNMVYTPKFHFCHLSFTMPASINSLVLKIKDEASGFPVCPYSFAIDDIQFTAIGPEAKIEFDGTVGPMLVKSVCFQDNKTISISGTVGAYYSNTSLQWQQTTNNGLTWTDIPGATNNTYSAVFSVPDTFLFRLTAAETVNIGNPNCRVVSNTLKVQVDGIPSTFNTTNNSPVCSGQDLQFNATGGASYTWTGPNGFYDDIAFPHIYFSSLTDSGMYYVDVKTLGGCHGKDSTYAKVIGTDVHAGPDTAVCKGKAVNLLATAGLSYSWSPAHGLSNVSDRNPTAMPEFTTEYTVKVTDRYGCSDTAKVQVKIINRVAVKAGIVGSRFLCRPYDSASFKDISTGNIIKWRWDFGQGLIDTQSIPSTQYYSIPDNADGYTVKLVIADSVGCTDTAYQVLKGVSNCYIAVPLAFSPNGDGMNDYLYPLNAYKATNLSFSVYNRKGQLIFTTKDWTKKWDGTFKGSPQDPGAYVWILQYENEVNKKILLKGTAVLLR